MRLQDFAKYLKEETDFPLAYYEFQPGQAPKLPYVVYLQTGNDPTFADNINYADSRLINVELYSNKKDIVSEEKITNFFYAHEIAYTSFESYLKDEKMYEVLYQISI